MQLTKDINVICLDILGRFSEIFHQDRGECYSDCIFPVCSYRNIHLLPALIWGGINYRRRMASGWVHLNWSKLRHSLVKCANCSNANVCASIRIHSEHHIACILVFNSVVCGLIKMYNQQRNDGESELPLHTHTGQRQEKLLRFAAISW